MTPLGVILVTSKLVTPLLGSGMTTLVVMVKLLKPKIRVARRWFKKILLILPIAGILVAVFYLVFKSDFFIIKHINCWVKDKTSVADEKRWCNAVERELLGQKILYPKTQATASQIGYRFLPVGEVKITKKYPQTVLIEIIERKPIAKVSPPGGREFLVDKEGVVFSETAPETKDLKKIILELEAPLSVGQAVGEDTILLILLEDPQIRSIKHTGQKGIEVQTEENLTILFSREKNLESQVRSLQMIVKKYRIEGKELKQVDLRYEQPVVKY